MTDPVGAPSRQVRPGRRLPRGIRATALLVATLAGIGLCVLLAAPFLGAIVWGAALAILFAPLHRRIGRALPIPNLATALTVLVVLVAVAVPGAFLAQRLVQEAASSANFIQAQVASGALDDLLDVHPTAAQFGKWLTQQIDLPTLMASVTTWLSGIGASFMRGSVLQVLEVFLTFYLLFYLLRDSRPVLGQVRRMLPLTVEESDRLFRRVTDTVRVTIYGTLAVSALQGALGALIFWLLGLPTPLLWGLVMAVLSIVPVLGAFVIWVPAAVLLALKGDWISASVLAVWGVFVIGVIDDVLRPMLVGHRLSLHAVPTFISMMGGVILFGASGLLLGPITFTTTMLLIEIWTSHDQPDQPNVPDE